MFRYVMTLGFIQLGIGFLINLVIKLLNPNIVNWMGGLGILLGALLFSSSYLKKNPDLFAQVSKKSLSFSVAVFHLIVSGVFILLVSMKTAGGVDHFLVSIQDNIQNPTFLLIAGGTLVAAYFLIVGLTYWGLTMGQGAIAKRRQKSEEK